MADTMTLYVVTPDREFYNGEVTMVEMNTAEGQIGVYPMHVPVAVMAAPGVLKIHEENEVKEAALISGFIQILPEKVTILADVCEWQDEIDAARANEARIRAERRISENNADIDMARAEASLSRALVRLSLSGNSKPM